MAGMITSLPSLMTGQAVDAGTAALVAIDATIHRQLDLRLRGRAGAIPDAAVTGFAIDLSRYDVRLV